jgi:DNA-3-methyladenine glycosylase I
MSPKGFESGSLPLSNDKSITLSDPSEGGTRCFGDGDPMYERYHDEEWGRPVVDEHGLYERVSLEGFQSGLSWLTILRKREAFRAAFAGFDPERVATFDERDVERLLGDAGIVRNRQKIEATIANARAILALRGSETPFEALVLAHRPPERPAAPATFAEVPASTPESTALAKALRKAGFRFVGPTTAYALQQAVGHVNDHLATCPVRADVEAERAAMLGF